MPKLTRIILAAGLLLLGRVAAAPLSPRGVQNVNEFMALRMNLSTSATDGEALERIAEFERNYRASAAPRLSEEESLVMDNFIVLEKYNYLRQDPSAADSLRGALKAQKDRNDAWFAAHKKEAASQWLYVTAADLISCYISFSFADVVRYGLSIKDYYQKALAQDARCTYVLTNIAQWYYWAPRINGGSKAKAGEYFEKAAAAASTPAETYFASIYLSQFVFESGDKARSAALLDAAERQCPQSAYVRQLRSVNAQGLSLFQYSKQNSKMDGKPKD